MIARPGTGPGKPRLAILHADAGRCVSRGELGTAATARAVAILADVHGNLPALEAVLADVIARGITEVVVAGDLLGLGAGPNAVVDRLVDVGATLLRGNHEADYVGGHADPALRAAWRADPVGAALAWYLDRLGPQRIALLTALPDRHWLDPATLVTHGSARHLRDAIRADTPCADLAAMYAGVPARLTFSGHTHEATIRPAPYGRAVNVGSVGAPLDGDPRAAYAVATRAPGAADGDWAVAIARVPYDVEAALAAYTRAMGVPDATFLALVSRQLRTARRYVNPWLALSATLRPDERTAALARFLIDDT